MIPIRPLRFDYSGCLIPEHGIDAHQLASFASVVEQARQEILKVDLPLYQGLQQKDPEAVTLPVDKVPLDAGFIELPERMLDDYASQSEQSELGQILETAKYLRDEVDRVVVLGIGGSYMGARALMDSCCQPYFNEFSRGERGGRPRMYFEGNNIDNDASQALLQLLQREQGQAGPESKWAIIVISKSGGTIETAVAFRQFLRAFVEQFGEDAARQLVVPVTGQTGKLAKLADEIGCQHRFAVPDGVGGRFSVFSPVGLLPAAVLGIDVIALLNGALAMNEVFHQAKAYEPGNNILLDYVAVNQLMEKTRPISLRLLSVWSKQLETLGLWYDQLFAESIGKQEMGTTPLTVVNSRDLHSRAQQHQEGRRDKSINNLIVEAWRYDPLAVGSNESNADALNDLAEKTLPDLMSAAVQGTNQAYHEDSRPTANLYLPRCDEPAIGQFMQMMMLATVVEGRMMGINPYGQPGVENYKKNMNRILRSGK